MTMDFLPSILYSCGHYLDNSDFFEWTSVPCKECAAKGVKSVTTLDCGGEIRLNPRKGIWERLGR